MDDDVEFQFEREIELLLKKNGLAILEIVIGQFQLFSARGDLSHGGGGSSQSGGRATWKAVIIKSTLPNRHDFGMTG